MFQPTKLHQLVEASAGILQDYDWVSHICNVLTPYHPGVPLQAACT